MDIEKSVPDLETVDCPVCGPSPTVPWMDDGKPTRYVRCKTCRTVYASPRSAWKTRFSWLDENFRYGEKAIQNGASRSDGLRQEAQILKTHIHKGRLLDIGCDLGDLFQWFAGEEWERYGFEVSPSAAEFASATHQAKVYPGTIHAYSYPGQSFDLVTILDTLYYVDNPGKDLQEIRRLLKPDGILAIEITGQSYQLLRSRGVMCWLIEGRWTRLHTDSSYLNWFSPQSLEKLLQKNGFSVFTVNVIGSPETKSALKNFLSRLYLKIYSGLADRSPHFLTWAPKYIMLARIQP
jgi:SAM-dependent methyltransferase